MIEILTEASVRSLIIGAVVGVALRLFRVRNPQIEMTAWITVLGASFAMPLLLRWPLVRLPAVPVLLPPTLPMVDAPAALAAPALPVVASLPAVPVSGGIDIDVLLILYGVVAVVLLARLLIGLARTWRILHRAERIRAAWTQGVDMRMTDAVTAPVTFGRTILLPVAFADWSPAKRAAVLSHERSHVEHHDFAVQLLAAIHTALFWFSPLAWWLQLRLAFLAERTSDEAAIARVGSRIDYAEMLLDIAVGARGTPVGIAMARPTMLRQRVEILLSRSAPVAALPPLRRAGLILALLPGILLIGGTAWHAQAADVEIGVAASDQAGADDAGHSSVTIGDGGDDFVAIQHGGDFTMVNGSINVDGHHLSLNGDIHLDGRHISIKSDDNAIIDGVLNGHDHKDQILFRHDGTFYRITDSGLIGQVSDLLRPEQDLGKQQGELGRQQGDLGKQQGELGRQQGELGRQLGTLGRQRAKTALKHALASMRTDDDDKSDDKGKDKDADADDDAKAGNDYDRRTEEVNVKMKELSQQQSALGKQQAALGEQQRKLGQEQERIAHEAESKVHELLDQAVGSGVAKPLLP
jgi:beta-lactamase regulating signal transducer with metallopeptidase domain